MPRISKADLLMCLRSVENERDAWQQVALNPEADFAVRVEIPNYYPFGGESVIELWSLHASHRMSGPVLQIEHEDGSRTVRFLMDYRPGDCSYRRVALAQCQRAAIAFVESWKVA